MSTKAERAATIRARMESAALAHVAPLPPLLRKLTAAQGATILVLGDSTSDASEEWPMTMARYFAEVFPLVRIEYFSWTDGEAAWPAATAVQAGDGNHGTIKVYNASVGGKETHYFLAPNFDAMIAAIQPDTIFINLGHNENTAGPEFWRDDLLAFGETLTMFCPDADVWVMTQNPRRDSSATAAEQRRHMTQRLARQRGWGLVDTYRRFYRADGTVDTSLYIDEIHPNAAGEALIWDEIKGKFIDNPVTRYQSESSLLRPLATVLANAEFARFEAPPALPSWTVRECTPSRDAVNFQGANGYSVRLVAAAAAICYIEQAITGNALKPFLGQRCTFVAWIRRPSGANSQVGRVELRSTGGVNTIANKSIATTQGQGDFIPVSVSGRIDKTAGTVTARIYCENGTTRTGDVSVDRCWFGKGLLPRDIR